MDEAHPSKAVATNEELTLARVARLDSQPRHLHKCNLCSRNCRHVVPEHPERLPDRILNNMHR